MITLVSSPKYHLPKDMQHSVCTVYTTGSKRSLFASFSLRNLVSTRIQIGYKKEGIDHFRPGLPSTHTCCIGGEFYNPSRIKCTNKAGSRGLFCFLTKMLAKRNSRALLRGCLCLTILPKSKKLTAEVS